MDKENIIPAGPLDPANPMGSINNSHKESFSIDNTEMTQNASGNELHGGKSMEDSGLDLSKARERTFNKELSDLVDRIKSNEPLKSESRESAEEISEDDLLQMFHQLFYKSVNIPGIEQIDTSINPFDLYKDLSSDDLVYLIYNEMSRLSFNEYSILSYTAEKKCYSYYINHIKDINENNLIIDPSEALYFSIINNKYGIILDRQTIERDIYYKKRFSGKKSLYFIFTGDFFRNYFNNSNLRIINDFADAFFPILIIPVKDGMVEHRKSSIYRLIESKLTIYFFLLYRKIALEKQNTNYVNLQDIYNFLDSTFQRYNKYKECVCSIIKCRKYINTESFFILKYLQVKLEKKLTGSAEVIRIEKDKLIIFSFKFKKKAIDDILDDLNKIYNDLFRSETFTDDGIKPAGIILQNIKEYLIN